MISPKHRRRPWWLWLSGGIAGFGLAVATVAFWTDTATLIGGEFQSGNLDITLNDNLEGQGGTWQNVSFAISNMVPGESMAADVTVGNDGTVPLNLTATATATGDLATGTNGLVFTVYPNRTASNTGSQAQGNRAGSCVGEQALTFGPAHLSSDTQTPSSVITTPINLAVAGELKVCIVVALPSNAANDLQGKSANTVFVFNAKQVNAP